MKNVPKRSTHKVARQITEQPETFEDSPIEEIMTSTSLAFESDASTSDSTDEQSVQASSTPSTDLAFNQDRAIPQSLAEWTQIKGKKDIAWFWNVPSVRSFLLKIQRPKVTKQKQYHDAFNAIISVFTTKEDFEAFLALSSDEKMNWLGNWSEQEIKLLVDNQEYTRTEALLHVSKKFYSSLKGRLDEFSPKDRRMDETESRAVLPYENDIQRSGGVELLITYQDVLAVHSQLLSDSKKTCPEGVDFKFLLKTEMYAGCDVADICPEKDWEGLCLGDFKKITDVENSLFGWKVEKPRKKSGMVIAFLVRDEVYALYEDYCKSHNRPRNKAIFNVSKSAVYHAYDEASTKAHCAKVGSKQIRKLTATRLAKHLLEAKDKLAVQNVFIDDKAIQNAWTGHVQSEEQAIYIKNHFPDVLQALQFIEEGVLIGTASQYLERAEAQESHFTEEVKKLSDQYKIDRAANAQILNAILQLVASMATPDQRERVIELEQQLAGKIA